MKAAIYARVSTERQAERGTIGSQLEALRSHLAGAGDEPAGEYCDDGCSGARLDRPGLDALRDAAEAGLFEVVWCLSRTAITARQRELEHKRTSLAAERADLARGNQLRHGVEGFACPAAATAWRASPVRPPPRRRVAAGLRRAARPTIAGRWWPGRGMMSGSSSRCQPSRR